MSTTPDDGTVDRVDGAEPGQDAPARGPATPPIRRHLVVLAVAVIGIVVGSILVLSGRHSDETTTSTAPATTTTARPLENLGSVADEAAATRLIGTLDPTTLEPRPSASTTTGDDTTVSVPQGVDVSQAGFQRCGGAIAQQNVDRSLGTSSARKWLLVGDTAAFVVSYRMPASGSLPATTRVLLVDARTCRVMGAVEP